MTTTEAGRSAALDDPSPAEADTGASDTAHDVAAGDPPDVDAFRAEVAAFLAAAKADGVACPAFGAILPPALHDRARAWQRHLHDAGYAGLHWPVADGGRGFGVEHQGVWSEECARAQVTPYLNLQGLVLAGEAIRRSGTDEQRRRFLPSTLRGDILWCQLFSEPDAGSDLASLTTKATLDGDRYVVDGRKVWSSNAAQAEWGILLARTDPAERSHRGISFFLLDMAAAGVEVRPITQMTGDQEFCEVVLDQVEVPVTDRLGPENEGWRITIEVLTDERGSSDAGLIALERRLAYLRSMATDEPAHRDQLLRLYLRGQALRAMALGPSRGAESASAAKLLRTELEFDIEVLVASLRGADALLVDDTTRRLLYAPGMRIAGGTSEIQRNIIAERILGLPREPRA